MRSAHLKQIEEIVQSAIEEGEMSGCVVAIGRCGKITYLEAFGHRQLEPEKVAMTTDTVFDLASVTKPVATGTSIMMLLEQGQLRLHDKVADHLPEFSRNDKGNVTILHLLTHQGGLIPDNALDDYLSGSETAFQKIYDLKLQQPAGEKFVYTDVGFILLGAIVEKLSGQDVADFSREHLFQPLGMRETMFCPEPPLRKRAAVTEQRDGEWMQGEVHDPRAHALGGAAGHAGLFSTAADLAIYAQMMLNQGTYHGVRVLSPLTVQTMTDAYEVSSGRRGLGWDKQSSYSSNRSELYSPRAFGHGGFTGTALWVDPELDMFVIFLGSRLHPDGKGLVNPLIGRIGTVAAAAIERDCEEQDAEEADEVGKVLSGIDVLQRDKYQQLRGQRIGLITNHTGINRDGTFTAELLRQAEEVDLVALFSPEHGLYGKLDQQNIGDTKDPVTGLHVFSLYGETRRPTAESLKEIDTIVFDIQDIGARFYTYISTMGYAMEEAAKHGKRFVVLDRVNPINGVDVAGPVLDEGKESFVAYHSLPVRHGMTVGELARMFKGELNLDLDLEIIEVEAWQRDDYYDATGLLWVNPSPNMRSLNQALLYPGIGLLETTNVSVGRGTDTPFEILGAPWIKAQELAAALNTSRLRGVRFVPSEFTPTGSTHAEKVCGGVQILITDRDLVEPLKIGWTVAHQLQKLYGEQWESDRYQRLLGDEAVLAAIKSGRSPAEIEALYQDELQEFLKRREQYLIYGQ